MMDSVTTLVSATVAQLREMDAAMQAQEDARLQRLMDHEKEMQNNLMNQLVAMHERLNRENHERHIELVDTILSRLPSPSPSSGLWLALPVWVMTMCRRVSEVGGAIQALSPASWRVPKPTFIFVFTIFFKNCKERKVTESISALTSTLLTQVSVTLHALVNPWTTPTWTDKIKARWQNTKRRHEHCTMTANCSTILTLLEIFGET